jgi:DNA-3-methyladenine glycosylase II
VLTLETLHEAAAILAARDADLARVVDAFGHPPMWAREPGFGTLVYIILEQQVSLASARAAYLRLSAAISPLSPQNFLTLDDSALKAIGFSRQKTTYGRILARAILDGELDLERLKGLEDDQVRAELTRIKGIGRWTADIYLMEALLRPDVWPAGDLALAIAVRRVKNLEMVPGPAALAELGEVYRPWRAVAARLFWHHYLSVPVQRSFSSPNR